MKKICIFVCLIACFSVLFTGCSKNDEKLVKVDKSSEYPYQPKGFTRFFTDEMKSKYPDILEIQKNSYKNYPNPFFEIKRNEKGLAGVYADGNLVIPHKYRRIEPCWNFEMFFSAKDDENLKVLDYQNNVIFQADYDNLNCSQESWCGVRSEKDGKYGMISYEGKEILKPEYDEIACQEHYGYSGGYYYIASKDDKYTVVSNKGDVMIPMQEKTIKPLSMHFFRYEKDGKSGVIDMNGKVILKPEYNSIEHTPMNYEKLKSYFTVCKEKCGAIDENGEIILPLKFPSTILKVSEDYYIVGERQRGMDIIDKHGKIMNKHTHDSLMRLNDYYVMFVDFGSERQNGVMDVKGNVVMKPIPNVSVKSADDNGLIKIQKDRKYGLVYKNKILLEPIYDRMHYSTGNPIMMLRTEEDGQYYYVSNYDDFIKSEGKNLKKYKKSHFVKTDREDCLRLMKDDGSSDYYCKNNNPKKSVSVEY